MYKLVKRFNCVSYCIKRYLFLLVLIKFGIHPISSLTTHGINIKMGKKRFVISYLFLI